MQQSAVVQKTVLIFAAIILVATVVCTGGEAEARQKVVIFHAGSLKVPLAEKFYEQPGLYDRLIQSRPVENVRAKAVELVVMLKNGKMDYAWEYLSVAVQNDLKFVRLSDQINLGNYKFDNFYQQATVKVTGPKSGTWITRTGKSVTYGVTMIKDSANPDGAILFLQYMLTPDEGLAILKSMGQPPFVPYRVPNPADYQLLPAKLKTLVEVRP